MNSKGTTYHLILSTIAILAGITGKSYIGLSLTGNLFVGFIIGLVVSLVSDIFCVKEVHHVYQHGRIRNDGTVEQLDVPFRIYHDWYHPVLSLQVITFPANMLLGAIVCVLVKAYFSCH